MIIKMNKTLIRRKTCLFGDDEVGEIRFVGVTKERWRWWEGVVIVVIVENFMFFFFHNNISSSIVERVVDFLRPPNDTTSYKIIKIE